MFELLYRFLVKYRKVDLPGIGTIALQLQGAESAFVDHTFLPPKYFFILRKGSDSPPANLFTWLASHFNITETEAVIQFNDFIYDLTRQLKEGKEIHWKGVGIFHKEFSGEIKFDSADRDLPGLEEVIAEKVIRGNADHTMLVGENEKTSQEMTEYLNHSHATGRIFNYWWVWPLALILATLIFLGWYFSEYSITPAAAGNHQKISPESAPRGYSLTE